MSSSLLSFTQLKKDIFENMSRLKLSSPQSQKQEGDLFDGIEDYFKSPSKADSLEDFITSNKRFQKTSSWEEISFEQEFGAQHQASFKMEYQNYIELIKLETKIQTGESKLALLALAKPRSYLPTPLSLLQKLPNPPSEYEFVQDQIRLTKYEKLQSFLQFITKTCSSEVAAELVMLALRILAHHDRNRSQTDSAEDLKQKAEFLASSEAEWLFESKKLKYLNLDFLNYSSSLRSCFSRCFETFLKFFYVTIVLTAQQYFENPNYRESKCQDDTADSFLSRKDLFDFQDSSDEIFFDRPRKIVKI